MKNERLHTGRTDAARSVVGYVTTRGCIEQLRWSTKVLWASTNRSGDPGLLLANDSIGLAHARLNIGHHSTGSWTQNLRRAVTH